VKILRARTTTSVEKRQFRTYSRFERDSSEVQSLGSAAKTGFAPALSAHLL
jgi:hypothetical protein